MKLDPQAVHTLWEAEYVPHLWVVQVEFERMPASPSAESVRLVDADDEPTAWLRDLLAPVPVFAEDDHLISTEVSLPGWREANAAIPKIQKAEAASAGTGIALYVGGLGTYGLGKGAVALLRTQWGRIATAALAVAVVVSRDIWWERAARRLPAALTGAKDGVKAITHQIGQDLDEGRHGEVAWKARVGGEQGTTLTHQVARLLCTSAPMTRGEIAESLLPQESSTLIRALRKDLLPVMTGCSAFVAIGQHRWQFGMQLIASEDKGATTRHLGD